MSTFLVPSNTVRMKNTDTMSDTLLRKNNFTILIVEDDCDVSEALALLLSTCGYTTQIAQCRDQAMPLILSRTPSLILLDLNMPGMSADDFVRAVRENDSKTPIVLFSADADIERRATSLGLVHFLAKPSDLAGLLLMIRDCLTPIPG